MAKQKVYKAISNAPLYVAGAVYLGIAYPITWCTDHLTLQGRKERKELDEKLRKSEEGIDEYFAEKNIIHNSIRTALPAEINEKQSDLLVDYLKYSKPDKYRTTKQTWQSANADLEKLVKDSEFQTAKQLASA